MDKGEIKLTAFADDTSYFVRDENSAINLMTTIESFSKIFGLQINKSKSECLLLQFETQVSNYNDSFLEIPIVQNVKVLGHYFG